MENLEIYEDIKARTDGDIYVGVVGPVRTGKSTFIKNFMDLLVIPNIENSYKKEDMTKYGEFVCSAFHWLPIEKQKEQVEKMENRTKTKDKK